MKTWERLLLIFDSLILVSIFTALMLLALGWNVPLTYLQTALADVNSRWIMGVVAAVMILWGLNQLVSVFRVKPAPHALLKDGKLGEVRISTTALENMVERVARSVEGVREVRPRMRLSQQGIGVLLLVVAAPDSNIPLLTGELQQQVKEHVEKYAGVDVFEVQVLIQNIGDQSKSRVE